METEIKIPRFCPNSCGEVLIATPPTNDELAILKIRHPKGRAFWHIKCPVCGHQSFIIDVT